MSCSHQNIDRRGYCIFCGAKVEQTESPHSNWNDPINPFDMAKAIKEKEQNDKNKSAHIKKPYLIKLPSLLKLTSRLITN